jgi:hypothetical protein
MTWALGLAVFLVVALGVRRLLHIGAVDRPFRSPSDVLGPQRETLYSEAGREIETRITMAAVSLNEAIEEQRAGRPELSAQLLSLVVSEWIRLAEIVQNLQALTIRYLVLSPYTLPLRPLTTRHFRSPIMADHVRFHSFLDQFILRPRRRFQLHVGILRHATQILTEEVCRCDPALTALSGRGGKLDYYFHDFDLVAKETLVAFRSLLACLPDSALADVAQEIGVLGGGRVIRVPLLADDQTVDYK